MSDRSHVINGQFRNSADGWTLSGTAAFKHTDGMDHYGVISLPAVDDYIEQQFAVPYTREYLLHFSAKMASTRTGTGDLEIRILDAQDVLVHAVTAISSDGEWWEYENKIGLARGENFKLRVYHVADSNEIVVDDIWLYHVPASRHDVAEWVHNKLGRLASDRSLRFTSDGKQKTEADYTFAVSSGLRQMGAINPETDLPDVRYLLTNQVDLLIDLVEGEMLETLQRDYLAEVDISVGPRKESRSQKAAGIQKLMDGKGSTVGRIVMRKLKHK